MGFGAFAAFTGAFFAAIAGLIWLLTYLEQTLESRPQNRDGSSFPDQAGVVDGRRAAGSRNP